MKIFFISPDLFFSRIYKNMVFDHEKKGKLIATFNLMSFFFPILIVILLVFINRIKPDMLFSPYSKIILVYRFISRAVEVILAFIQDISETNKTTNLKSNQRVVLAFTFLFEILILTNAILYLSSPQLAKSIMYTFSLLIDFVQVKTKSKG